LCYLSTNVYYIVVVYFVMTQSGNFWLHPRIYLVGLCAVWSSWKI